MRRLVAIVAALAPALVAAGTADAFLRLTLGPTRYVTSVTVSPTSASIGAGSTQDVTATALPTNATSRTVNWTKVSGCDASDAVSPTSTTGDGIAVTTLTAYSGGTIPRTCVVRATAADGSGYSADSSITITAASSNGSATVVAVAGTGAVAAVSISAGASAPLASVSGTGAASSSPSPFVVITSPSEGATVTLPFTVTGIALPASTVQLVDGSGASLGSGVSDLGGNWTITVSSLP